MLRAGWGWGQSPAAHIAAPNSSALRAAANLQVNEAGEPGGKVGQMTEDEKNTPDVETGDVAGDVNVGAPEEVLRGGEDLRPDEADDEPDDD